MDSDYPARRFGVSEFTTLPWSFEKDVETYAKVGIPFIEVTEIKLDRERYAEQLALVKEGSLKVSSVQATLHGLFPTKLQPEPVAPGNRLTHIRDSIARIARHVPEKTPFVVITGAPPNGDVAAVRQSAVRGLKELSKFAQSQGVRIALEPLNPTLMNVDSAIWSLGQAMELVEAVDEEACGLCVDTWNIWESPELRGDIQRAGVKIFLVQLSDYGVPRGFYDRLNIGDGCIPMSALMESIERSGYAGPYVLEIFSSESLPHSFWLTDLEDLLRKNLQAFNALWTDKASNARTPV